MYMRHIYCMYRERGKGKGKGRGGGGGGEEEGRGGEGEGEEGERVRIFISSLKMTNDKSLYSHTGLYNHRLHYACIQTGAAKYSKGGSNYAL